MATLTAIFVASLLGSLHCAGMCGPLVAFAVGLPQRQSRLLSAAPHVAYHGGRLISYAILGAAAGLLGAVIDQGASLAGVHRFAAWTAGAIMIASGIIMLVQYAGIRVPLPPVPDRWRRWLMAGQRRAASWGPVPRAGTMGLLSGLLPCGWLYAFVLLAAGTANAGWGAVLMASFWFGTLPVMGFVGVAVQGLTGKIGQRIPLVTAAVVIALGIAAVTQRWSLIDRPMNSFGESAGHDHSLHERDTLRLIQPPCCNHDRP